MKILMVGGTGIISTGVSERLLANGAELWLLTRGTRPELIPSGVHMIKGDISDETGTSQWIKAHHFDVVVDWMVFTPEQAERDIRIFEHHTDQYVFIGSGSSYQRPSRNYLVTEQTPLDNPFSEYAHNKAMCETVLMNAHRETGFPVTIVRPSLTYGDICIPYVLNSWHKPWTLIDRLQRGKPIIVPGDGTSLWEITHNSDFAKGLIGLFGQQAAHGEAFHITSGEVMTWDSVLLQIADAAGFEAKITHISSEFICAFMPEEFGSLVGDKISSVVFDNAKIKRFVPDFQATVPFRKGIQRTIRYLQAHPEWQVVDEAYNQKLDRVIEAHQYGMSLAKK